MDPKLFTGGELGKIAHVSPETVRRWKAEGKGPKWVKIGRQVLYPADSVQEWIDSLKGTAA